MSLDRYYSELATKALTDGFERIKTAQEYLYRCDDDISTEGSEFAEKLGKTKGAINNRINEILKADKRR